jgi:hypothetical protein
MIKVVYPNPPVIGRNITLNEILLGQVFEGNVYGKNSRLWCRGIFYKAHGQSSIRGPRMENGADVIVVRLDSVVTHSGYANCYLMCSEVQDYVPLEVSLTITKRG